MQEYLTAFVTVPDQTTADKLVNLVLTKKAVACAQILSPIQSRYWWNGEIQTDSELLLIFKLTSKRWELFLDTVLEVHPYEAPEVIALPIKKGHKSYFKWLEKETNTE
ncbi:MAG: divalent-cation tolerance protein CutA [Limisphaerales bacterium]|jgi:periplasmic divalent cation tolerance protein|nr:divalent-cation tolerance protein CutA [Verrucomicrobiota bacterium]